MTKDTTHYMVLNVKDLKALLAYAEEVVRKNGFATTSAWTPDMTTIVLRLNTNEYSGQLSLVRVNTMTMNEIRRGDF